MNVVEVNVFRRMCGCGANVRKCNFRTNTRKDEHTHAHMDGRAVLYCFKGCALRLVAWARTWWMAVLRIASAGRWWQAAIDRVGK